MTDAARSPLKLFQFPRMFAIPNLSLFCCKLETWLRITRIPTRLSTRPIRASGRRASSPSSRKAACRSPIRRASWRTRICCAMKVSGTRERVQRQIRGLLWTQGILRHSDEEIVEAALRDWRAVLPFMSPGPFFFGDKPCGLDAIVFGTLATTVLTPIESPIRDFLRAQPQCLAYAERMRGHYFPELAHGQD